MTKVQRRRRREDDCTVDRISMLPDEVLGLILSFLTFKEATATSILCCRWRWLWSLTPKLYLDWTATLDKLIKSSALDRDRETSNYLRWVDSLILFTLPKYSSTNLSEFRVLFDLSESHKVWIDHWLGYAVSRTVQSLDLNLIDVFGGCKGCYSDIYETPCYRFPYNEGNFPSNLSMLKKLSMHLVNVSGEAVAFLLGNCRLLEQLSVSRSHVLLSLEIFRTSPLFKCLEISMCSNLKSVEVRESEIVSIKYNGVAILARFVLVDVPLLTELWIQAPFPDRIRVILDMFKSMLPQLHTLKIYAMSSLSWKVSKEIISRVEMPNLKELVVILGKHYEDTCSLVPVINLISVAPYLQRFVVEASHQEMSERKKLCLLDGGRDPRDCYTLGGEDWVVKEMHRKKKIRRAYSHIKEVEFVGYRGVRNHLGAIIQLVKHGAALENILVDPRSFELRVHMPWDRISRNQIEDEIFARNHAKENLIKYVPSRINLNIL